MSTHLQGLEGLLYLLDLNLAVNQITEIGEQSSRHKKITHNQMEGSMETYSTGHVTDCKIPLANCLPLSSLQKRRI